MSKTFKHFASNITTYVAVLLVQLTKFLKKYCFAINYSKKPKIFNLRIKR